LALTSAGTLNLSSDAAMNLAFSPSGGFILKSSGGSPVNYLQIASDGTLTLTTGSDTKKIVLNPGGMMPGQLNWDQEM